MQIIFLHQRLVRQPHGEHHLHSHQLRQVPYHPDAGNGLYKADRYIKDDLPVFLFLSHFHLDHIEGLHVLSKFHFKSLIIFGQKGTKQVLSTIINEPFTVPLEQADLPG